MAIQQTINETARFTRPADEVWKACGEPGDIADWLPAVEKSWMEGDVRVAELAGGAGQAREKITGMHADEHYYDYSYVGGPLVLKEFTSRLAVVPIDGGAEVQWTAEFQADTEEEGTELTAAVSGMYRGGLDNLLTILSGTDGK